MIAAQGYPPKLDNFEAMCAAWDDPVRFAAECARYDEQLVAAGFPPVERGRWAA